MVLSTFRLNANAEPAKILRRVYRAELYKFVITIGLFSLVLLNMDVSFGPMLGGFAATLTVYWAALGVRLPLLGPKTSAHSDMSKG
jgi:F0F1-type ATP synthase assembly protein I